MVKNHINYQKLSEWFLMMLQKVWVVNDNNADGKCFNHDATAQRPAGDASAGSWDGRNIIPEENFIKRIDQKLHENKSHEKVAIVRAEGLGCELQW